MRPTRILQIANLLVMSTVAKVLWSRVTDSAEHSAATVLPDSTFLNSMVTYQHTDIAELCTFKL